MIDVDRRMAGINPAHAAGLRRLSARAAAAPASTNAVSHSGGLLSFRPLAELLLSRLRAAQVPLLPGLYDAELARLEADLAVSFPPDLRALLALGLPSAPGFPDWRPSSSSCPRLLLRAALDLPLAAGALQVARGTLWPRSWGSRPADPDRALRIARAALRRSPVLIPVFDRCYIPCRPCIAGNPVFYVDEHQVFCCGFDLADFFEREPTFRATSPPSPPDLNRTRPPKPPLPPPSPTPARRSLDAVAGRTSRWIEFWSDAASDRRRRNSSSSSSSSDSATPPRPDPERFVEIRSPRQLPGWVDCYLERIGSVLRSAGWGDSEIGEIIGVPPSGIFDSDDEASLGAALDAEAALDALMVKADRCSASLRQAGWSSDEVSDALGFDFLQRRRRREERPPVKVPPEIAVKVEQLAKAVS
ncbi:hypothetical protein Cni_G28816 [Canna indica]|uniref:Knr4/Smi1-like domain-containing protein n=1 Tax=Canna indica TaxID=4628 RepID=A0AAQ3L3P0_9LILI|nr:hypothetical protein Cni_G28816 [Canna indica]